MEQENKQLAVAKPMAVTSVAESFGLTPASIDHAVAQRKLLADFIGQCLVENEDYGIIPGTGTKKVLHKPGAEKLGQIFKLRPEFHSIELIEDFDKLIFHYRYECRLYHFPTGTLVGSGIGSCNSRESKYGWRKAGRICPSCGADAIKQSKWADKSPEKGWYCFDKIGGCGAQFHINDKKITDQKPGRVLNPDICDQVNTLDKMAQKRAFLAAILVTVGCSDYFTQDLEESVDPKTGEVTTQKPTSAPKNATSPHKAAAPKPKQSPLDKKLDADLNTLARQEFFETAEELIKQGIFPDTDTAIKRLLDNDQAEIKHIENFTSKEKRDKVNAATQMGKTMLQPPEGA